ncbi:MAG: hypothetical protein PHV07_00355 [Oscillospiraceae bacterium]|nr:hypothetical protein [Oscillospiraceae bacterium]
MKYINKITVSVLSLIVLLSTACFPVSAVATVTASIKVSSSSVSIGDTVIANYKFDASETIYVVKMNGTYNSSVLRAESSDEGVVANGGIITATVGGGGQGTEISFSVTFKAIAAGDCKLTVLGSEIDELVDHPTASVNINVKNPSAESSSGGDTNVSSATSDDDILIDGIKYKLSNNSSGVNIPNGFEETTYVINSKEMSVFKHKTVDMVLVCLNNASTGNKLFVYDKESSTFSGLIELAFQDRKYIVANDYKSDGIPANYVKTAISIQDISVTLWHIENSELSDFHLLYLINQEGNFGLYQYDSTESTVQRYVILPTDNSELINLEAENESLSNSLKTARIVGGVFVVLSSLLIFLLVVSMIVSKKNRKYKH